jgi:hypothetical protein
MSPHLVVCHEAAGGETLEPTGPDTIDARGATRWFLLERSVRGFGNASGR